MYGDRHTAFSCEVVTPLVRYGEDERLPPDDEGRSQHRLEPVYREMLTQISFDYASLPDPRTMTLSEIRFYYDGLREVLKTRTKPSD